MGRVLALPERGVLADGGEINEAGTGEMAQATTPAKLTGNE